MSSGDKPKLLYIMGIDWNWIFQRPQIIEQHLEQTNEVTVVFPRSILKLFHKKVPGSPRNYKVLWTLPLQEKIKFIGEISRLLNRHIFQNACEYEMIVVGFPLYYRYVPSSYRGILIYDCMDNHEALYGYRDGVPELVRQEELLIERSSLVFVSSLQLLEKLKQYEISPSPRMVLMRNGVEWPGRLLPIMPPMHLCLYKIGYIGTIAGWLDKELLLDSLRQIEDIEYHLIGPVNIELPKNESKLIAEGTIQHELLHDKVKAYSCLVMPFLVNETVLYVDPVKLYEYIAMGKCIVTVFYPEIERFRDFVYFYHGSQEYIDLLAELKQRGFPPKYSDRQRKSFLKENSWETRFQIWDKAIRDVIDTI